MAAGDGKRMKSSHSKVVHQVAGKPIVKWVYDALCEAGCEEQVYIVGEKQEEIRDVLGEGVAYVFQEQRLGTGHAVMQGCVLHCRHRASSACSWSFVRYRLIHKNFSFSLATGAKHS